MNTKFNDLSDEEVEKMLTERQKHKAETSIPKPLSYDKERHDKFIRDMDSILKDESIGEGNDSEHWIFETALIYVFGPKVFDAWNKFPNKR